MRYCILDDEIWLGSPALASKSDLIVIDTT